jgi:hypothetical protein
MATNIELVQQLYVAYFNRPGDVGGVNFYTAVLEANPANYDAIAADFAKSAEYQAQFSGKVAEEVIDIVYMNMFGRHAEKAALDFYGPLIQNGTITIDKVVLDIVKGAQGTDQVAYDSKVAAAIEFTEFLDTPGNEQARIAYVSGKGDSLQIARDYLIEVKDAATLATAVAGLAAVGAELGGELNEGKVINLTKGVDSGSAFLGGAGNDTIVGVLNGAESTYTALDTIDGGSGVDTLSIASITAFAQPGGVTVTNVEKVAIVAADEVGAFVANGTGDIDFSTAFATVGELSVSKAETADFKAGAATAVIVTDITGGVDIVGGASQTVSLAAQGAAVKVSGSKGAVSVTSAEQGNNGITVDGGSTVTVSATSTVSNGAIAVGGTTAATGAVSVTSNLESDGSALTGNTIAVTGGSTVNVTVNAASVAADQTAAGATAVGAITVTGDGKTTAVTVAQDVSATKFTKAGTAAVKETSVVTFGAMKANEVLTINGLTFTAAKALTAEQVAAAFANLTSADTQSATGPVANGIYTGTFNSASWTSGAVSGKTVTFTAKDEDEVDLAFTGDATTNDAGARIPTQVKTAGTAAVAAIKSTNTAAAGTVRVDDAATAAITSVTLDGYGTADIGVTGNALDKLAKLSLANSAGAVTVDSAATTLDLTINAVGHAVDLDNGSATVATLKVHTATDDSEFALTAAAVKDLTVDGTKSVDLTGSTLTALETVTVSGAAGLDLGAVVAAKSIVTTGTTGTVTATIDGNAATYTGGAGVDNVTLNNATVSKAINLGGGNDSLKLNAGTTSLGVEVVGGEGTDTLVMNSADAAGATVSNVFETKVTGFEKLSLNAALAGAADVVDMANMDDINYVISANAAAAVANVQEVQTFSVTNGVTATKTNATQTLDFTGVLVDAAGAGTITVGGVAVNVASSDNAAAIATKVAAALNGVTAGGSTQAVRAVAAGNVVTFTIDTRDGALANLAAALGTATLDGGSAAIPANASAGVAYAANAQTIVVGGVNVVLDAQDKTATGTTVAGSGDDTTTEVATKIVTALDGNGTFDAAGTTSTAAAVTAKWAANGDQGNITFTANASGVTIGTIAETVKGSTLSAAGGLTLKNFAANGTLELTAAGSGVTVDLVDATGTADSLNIVTKVVASDLNFGTVAAAGVETIVLTATDTKLDNDDDGANDAVSKSTIVLSDAALTKVTVNGNANVDLQLNANVVALATVDASTLTGKLTHITNGTVAETVTGGSAADTLTAKSTSSTADKLIGGAGNDILTGNKGLTQMTGGAGADSFNVTVASLNVNSASSIMDIGSGDKILFAGADAFKSGAITLDSTAVFQDFANAAIASITSANDLAWFQFGGNTYIVQEKVIGGGDAEDAFVNNVDFIVKIVGTVDLSTASFNASAGILEIA